MNEINLARNELQELQRNLGGGSSTNVFVPATTNGTPSGSLPTDCQSRLQQWKKNGGGVNGNGQDKNAANMDAALAGLVAGTQSLHINTEDRHDAQWKTGELNWSNGESLLGDSRKTSQNSDTYGSSLSFNGGNSHSGHSTAAGNTPTPPVDDGPPAFIPGKKWEWRDRKYPLNWMDHPSQSDVNSHK